MFLLISLLGPFNDSAIKKKNQKIVVVSVINTRQDSKCEELGKDFYDFFQYIKNKNNCEYDRASDFYNSIKYT